MLEALLGNPVVWGLLAMLGIAVFFGLFTLIAGLLEKDPLTIFVPPWSGKPLRFGDYATTMNDAAAAVGFGSHGTYEHSRGGIYQISATMWLAPERDTMALVSSGTMLKTSFKTTQFYTRTSDDRWLVTSDTGSAVDLSGLVEHRLLYNADFTELLQHHRERIESSTVEITPLSATHPWNEFDEMNAARAYRRVELGHCRFVDPARTMTRYTWTGACRMAVLTQIASARAAQAGKNRAGIKRPGHPEYIPFEARSAARPADPAVLVGQVASEPKRNHSGFGIASFVFAGAAFAFTVWTLVLAAPLNEDAPPPMGFVIVALSCLLCPVIGFVLAIVGLVQRNRKRLWSILGLVGNSMLLLLIAASFLLS